MTPKEYYRGYQADDSLSPLSEALITQIMACGPRHVLDFGSGSGKHLNLLNKRGIDCHGIDLSPVNVAISIFKHSLPSIAIGNDSHLRHYCNYDVVMTCSVLDHIEHIDTIIDEFKRIANVAVFLAETNDAPAMYYYPHIYEDYGFEKLPFSWKSPGDGAFYQIYKWEKL